MMTRRKAREVQIGSVTVGGQHPIAIQSMLCAPPEDMAANVAQARALYDAGCHIIRVAIPTMEDIRLIPAIKDAVPIPLVADIQFDYRLAVASARAGADKIRINPGNIGDGEKVRQVVDACRAAGAPIRIGVNSGSLEHEIFKKHGRPTADALVESALLNIRLLEELDFFDYLVAIKSSDVFTTVEATRKIAALTDCPLHLGVTEAGTATMGTIKSAAAFGALLADGIGDTLRVSLTADPVREVLAAKDILGVMGLNPQKPTLISCPTCGRCKVNLFSLVAEVEAALESCHKPIKVAVMGCAVNGPGEAKDADVGLAAGNGELLLFRRGAPLEKVSPGQAVAALIGEIEKL